jgi:hypothetical protein
MARHKEGSWFHRSRDHLVVRSTGRAIHHTSKAVHRLLAACTGLLVVVTCLLAAASWRLAQGPIDIGAWSGRLRAALINDASPVRVSFNGIFLAWEGFHKGVDHPLDVRVSDITISDSAGQRLLVAPAAHLTFSLAALLLGRIVPRAIEVDHAQIAVTRNKRGAIILGWDSGGGDSPNTGAIDPGQFWEQVSRSGSSDHKDTAGLLDQIQRAHFRATEVTLRDGQSGMIVRTSDMDLDLVRTASGHLHGSLQAPISVGDERSELTAGIDWAAGSNATLDVTLASLRPAGIGAFSPDLAFMAGVDVPLSLTATIGLDAHFQPSRIQADLQVGQGQIHVGPGTFPVRKGNVRLSATLSELTIAQGQFDVAPTPEANPELIEIAGSVRHRADRVSATLNLGVSQINIADLPRLWPIGVGGGARPWVVEHVTGGTATHGTASLAIEADDRLRDVVVTRAIGELDGTNATFTWLDNLPPVEQTDFHLHLVDPDTLDIRVSSARQRIRNGGADLLIGDGQMRISGLSLRDQIAVIRTQVTGPLPSALTLLREPRLHILSTHPIALKTGGGEATATLDFRFPLEDKLQIDDLDIRADAHLTDVRLLDIAGSLELDDGVFDLAIDKTGMTLKGQGSMAAVAVMLNGTMDFNLGPPDQIVQKIALTAQPDAAKFDAVGLQVTNFLEGRIPLTIVLIERRNGEGSVAINGDLTLATLAVNSLAWRKSSGSIAAASATLVMVHDRLTKIDKITVHGDGLMLNGSADFDSGHIQAVLLDTIRLGRTQAHGTVRFGANDQITVVLQGDQIDLSQKLTEKTPGSDDADATPVTSPDWTVDARFDHAFLANGEHASNVLVKATGGGQTIRLLEATGTSIEVPTSANSGFAIKIDSRMDKRHLLVEANDAGNFLRSIDAIKGMRSGHLMIDGDFDRQFSFHPLSGTALIDNVVVRNSPVLGKLLQGITLYGLVDALRGPGMTFSHIVLPFRYDGTYLNVDEAHAYNASLGLTANGRINVSSGQTSMSGTIVPAYFFNSMLGQLPLVGKLFSPEKGGGVFAARFGVDGQIDDPNISINPLSALTPGFLRDIFGVLDRQSSGEDGTEK